MNYKDAGVDIDAGNKFVQDLKKKVPYLEDGFGGKMKIPSGYDSPVLVSGADGVGTKLRIAELTRSYKTIGIDLVAMCVNDIITCGALPLYFLDYISCQKIDPNILSDIMDGVITGCEQAGCRLLGGETAEHPKSKDMDLAGFATGIVEEKDIIDGKNAKKGDKIIGLASSGVHSNGISLINHLLWHQKLFLKYRDKGDEHLGIGEEIMKPTEIYAPLVEKLVSNLPVVAMAHITGGGLVENVPRSLPKHLHAIIDYNSWTLPTIFSTIQSAGEVPEEEMKRVFNLGIGYTVVVPEEAVEDAMYIIRGYDSCVHSTEAYVIGEVVDNS